MANITKATVEKAKAPATGQLFVRDDELTGFALRITAAGVKSFVWEGRIRGRVRRLTLGQFPGMTVLAARKRVLEIKAAVADGEDPAEERQQERREPTFGDLVDAYIERHAKPRLKSWKISEQRLEAHFSRWRTRRLSDVSREEVGKVQHAIAHRRNIPESQRWHGGQIASNRAMTLLRAMFNWAKDEGIFRGDNPAKGLKLYTERKRERFLSPEELGRVNESLAQEPNEYWRAYFPLVLMLGLRKNELLGTRWEDIDFNQLTLRIPETKAGRSHLLPLPGAAVDLLQSLPSRGSSEWVFPSWGKTGHIAEAQSAWERIRDRAKVPDVTVHDLRRTLGSWLAASGHSLPLIGRALNHTSVNSTAIYARLDLGSVRQALESNAAAMRLGQ